MAKHTFTWNCFVLNKNGHFVSLGDIIILITNSGANVTSCDEFNFYDFITQSLDYQSGVVTKSSGLVHIPQKHNGNAGL